MRAKAAITSVMGVTGTPRKAGVEVDFVINHDLFRTRYYRRLVIAGLRNLASRQSAAVIDIYHADDGSCCRKMALGLTLHRLITELESDGQPARIDWSRSERPMPKVEVVWR